MGITQATVRVGIVGLGWGALHARVVADLAPHFQLRAICAGHPARATALADELRLPRSAIARSWEEVVSRDDVDLVVNTTPDHLHYPVTVAAIANGKHVHCEKPLAMDASQAREMLDAAERARIGHFVGFTWRFAAAFATLRRLIDEGALGRIQLVDGHFRIGAPRKKWQYDPYQRAYGVLGNLGVHLVDMVRFVGKSAAGVSPESFPERWRVIARLEVDGRDLASGGAAAPDTAWVHLRHDAESYLTQARLHVSQRHDIRGIDPIRVEVHGSEASAIAYAAPLVPERQRLVLVDSTSDSSRRVPLDFPGGPPMAPLPGLASSALLGPTLRHLYLDHIFPRLTGGPIHPHTPTFHDGWAAQRVLDAAVASSEAVTWVDA